MKIEKFEDIKAWQEARELVGLVYKAIPCACLCKGNGRGRSYMNDDQIMALVEHRLQRSDEAIRAARYMLVQGMLIFAMTRIYYSIL